MAFAVIYLPLITEFGGSRAEVAMVQSAVLRVGGISGPRIGWALRRRGRRPCPAWRRGPGLAARAGARLGAVLAARPHAIRGRVRVPAHERPHGRVRDRAWHPPRHGGDGPRHGEPGESGRAAHDRLVV